MSFWSDFSAFLDKEYQQAKTAVEGIWQFIKPMAVAGANEVAAAALQAVIQEAPKVISGEEKLASATSTVVAALAAKGKSVGINIAESAVQAAYNLLATSKPAS